MYNRGGWRDSSPRWNTYLPRDLTERDLWTPEVRNQIIVDEGSVQNVHQIPKELMNLHKTVWEINKRFIFNQVCGGVHVGRGSVLSLYCDARIV